MRQFFSDQQFKIYLEHYPGDGDTFIFIPGAYHTGVCYTTTPDGREGWARELANEGHNVFVTDLPATGRSGFVDFENVSGEFIVKAYESMINSLDIDKASIVTHSLSGPIGFKLAERIPEKVHSLISVEPGLIGNVQDVTEPLSEANGKVQVSFQGFDFTLDMSSWLEPSEDMVNRLRWESTEKFPQNKKSQENYIASLQHVHPQLMYERFNIKGSQLSIKNSSALDKVQFLIITGTEDPVHKDADYKIAEYLKEEDLNVSHIELGEEGIEGNGHMMMLEKNSSEILELILERI